MSYVGGARTPATGGTSVRGSPAIGKLVKTAITPLMPPELAPLRNPICPWDASTRWFKAFEADGLTVRSNQPQLQSLGISSNVFAPPKVGEPQCLAPAVTGGRLSFVVRPFGEVDERGYARPHGISALGSGLHTSGYLFSTEKLPVLPVLPSIKPAHGPEPTIGERSPRATPMLTPAHLLRNAQNEAHHAQKTYAFAPRRIGNQKNWTTMAMEQSQQVFGERAYW